MKKFITNDTTFGYKLNIFAATMLIDGIYTHYKMVNRLYKKKIEPKDYCWLMMTTVRKEAERLLAWLKKIKSPLANKQIEDAESLLILINKKVKFYDNNPWHNRLRGKVQL